MRGREPTILALLENFHPSFLILFYDIAVMHCWLLLIRLHTDQHVSSMCERHENNMGRGTCGAKKKKRSQLSDLNNQKWCLKARRFSSSRQKLFFFTFKYFLIFDFLFFFINCLSFPACWWQEINVCKKASRGIISYLIRWDRGMACAQTWPG